MTHYPLPIENNSNLCYFILVRIFKNTWFNRFADKEKITDSVMAVHQSAMDLYEIGAITEAEMKKFDESCLVQEPDTDYKTQKTTVVINSKHVRA